MYSQTFISHVFRTSFMQLFRGGGVKSHSLMGVGLSNEHQAGTANISLPASLCTPDNFWKVRGRRRQYWWEKQQASRLIFYLVKYLKMLLRAGAEIKVINTNPPGVTSLFSSYKHSWATDNKRNSCSRFKLKHPAATANSSPKNQLWQLHN